MTKKNQVKKEKNIKIKLNGSKISFICKIEKSKFEKFRISKLSKKIQSNIEFLTNITITNCNLTDLPQEFGNLPIRKLNLSHNALKFVPDVLYINLYRIQDLDLSYNLIEEFLAPNCLLSLAVLKINNNNLKVMPGWLWESSIRLKHLDISCNKFDMSSYGVMFKTFFSTMRLKWLSVASCNFGNCDAIILNRIPNLNYLDIGNRQQSDICKIYNCWDFPISQLDCKNNLKILHAQNLFLSAVPDNINELKHLTAIYLNGNSLHWLPESFGLLSNLTVCDLSNNSLSFFPTSFKNLNHLIELYLADNLFSNLPDYMNNFKQLHTLDLYNNNFEAIDLKLISLVTEIDIEQNYCSLRTIEYEKKKQKLRNRVSVERLNDPKKLVKSDTSENSEYCNDCSSSSYTFDKSESDGYSDVEENVEYDCQKSETNSLEEYWDSNYLDDNYIPLPPRIRRNVNSVSEASTFSSSLQEQYDLFELFRDAD